MRERLDRVDGLLHGAEGAPARRAIVAAARMFSTLCRP
jgi:hypothetical protein